MRILSLAFDPSPRTPSLHGLGIILGLAPVPQRKACFAFEVTCRMSRSTLVHKLALPAGIFLTAVHAVSQRPITTHLVQDRVLFEDDVAEGGGYVVVVIRGELDTSSGPIGPFFLHASCHQFVSNVIHVP
jgi:hypothetical protein